MCIFDIIILIVIITSLFIGMRNGLIHELASLLGLVIGVFCAVQFSSITEEKLSQYISFNGIGAVSFIITLVLVTMAVHFLSSLISKAVNTTLLGVPNRLLGGLFSVLKNMFFVSCFICGINYFAGDILETISHEEREKTITYEPIVSVAPYIFPYLDFGVEQIKDAINKKTEDRE